MGNNKVSSWLAAFGISWLLISFLATGSDSTLADSESNRIEHASKAAEPQGQHIRPLSTQEMCETRGGGVETWSFSIPFEGSEDNIQFVAAYENHSSSSLDYMVFAGDTKVAHRVVTGGDIGAWSERVEWPMSGYHTANTRYTFVCNGGSLCEGTSSTSPFQTRVDPDVHMMPVSVWNSTVGGITTSVTRSQIQEALDSREIGFDWRTSDTADAVWAQCSTASDARLQFRYGGADATGPLPILNLANCPNPLPLGSGPPPRLGVPQSCIDEVMNEASANGNPNGRLDVIVFPQLGPTGGIAGVHIRGLSLTNPDWYLIAVEEGVFDDPDVAMRTIAHEIGHWVLFPNSPAHTEDVQSTGCTGNNVNNELMCQSLASGGRSIPAARCNAAGGAMPFYYPDRN